MKAEPHTTLLETPELLKAGKRSAHLETGAGLSEAAHAVDGVLRWERRGGCVAGQPATVSASGTTGD